VAIFAGLVLLGGAQIWSGILSVQGRRSGRLMGLAVASFGVALAVPGLVTAALEDDPESLYTGIVLSTLLLATSVLVIVLLRRGQPVR
jgi:hypothetical protein